MKKRIVFLAALMLIMPIVYATLNVEITTPNGNAFNQKNVDFTCSATSDNTSLESISLYFGNETTWHENKTATISGLSATQTFSVQNIPNGNYLWNCKAKLTNLTETLANANFTFSVNYIAPPPAVNHPPELISEIPYKKWYKGENITIILPDYFTDIDKDELTYTVSGNSNIAISIANKVATLAPNNGWTGTEIVIFTANDGNTSTPSNNLLLNVTEKNNHNNNFEISGQYPLESKHASKGNETFYINVTGQSVTYTWTLNGTVVSTQQRYLLSNIAPGKYTLMVQASNGEKTLNYTWEVTIPNAKTATPVIQKKPIIAPVCGDGKKDANENCETCNKDAPCESGYSCVTGGKCQKKSSLQTIMIIIFALMALATGGYFAYELLLKEKIGNIFNKSKPEELGKEVEIIKKGVAEPAAATAEKPIEIKEATITAEKPLITGNKPEARQPKKVKKEDMLKDYALKMLDKGHREDEIINNLIKTGWPKNLAEEAIKSAKLIKQPRTGMVK